MTALLLSRTILHLFIKWWTFFGWLLTFSINFQEEIGLSDCFNAFFNDEWKFSHNFFSLPLLSRILTLKRPGVGTFASYVCLLLASINNKLQLKFTRFLDDSIDIIILKFYFSQRLHHLRTWSVNGQFEFHSAHHSALFWF